MLGTESFFTIGGLAQKVLPFAALLLMCPDLRAMGHQHVAWESHLAAPYVICVSSDFDGDHRIDWVSVALSPEQSPDRGENFTLAFHPASAGAWPALDHSSWTVQYLQASDVDGDQDADVILESAAEQPLAVWLNDGKGHFAPGNVNDYPELRLRRDPNHIHASATRESLDLASEDPGSNAVAVGAIDTKPSLVAAIFRTSQQASPARVRPVTKGARGPPAWL